MTDRDPLDTDFGPEDYDDDGSPKYATEAERAAGWAEANHAPTPVRMSERAAGLTATVDGPTVRLGERAAICPECRSSKHGNCDGTAFDEANDDIVKCQCPPAFGHR